MDAPDVSSSLLASAAAVVVAVGVRYREFNRPYGSWRSRFTSDVVLRSAKNICGLRLSLSGNKLFWMEGRPDNGGKTTVMCIDFKQNKVVSDVTEPGANVRSLVHEYGGVSYLPSGEGIIYSEFTNQQLFLQAPGRKLKAITAESSVFRYIDGVLDSSRGTLICVREDHSRPAPKDVVNTIVSIDLATGAQSVLACGADFYCCPRLSADGSQLAYVSWDHPNMPWDDTVLHVAQLRADGSVSSVQAVAGGAGGESVLYPMWSPRGQLLYVSDRSDWWNLYRWEPTNPQCPTAVLPMSVECGGQPSWRLGGSFCAFLSGNRLAAVHGRADGAPGQCVSVVELDSLRVTARVTEGVPANVTELTASPVSDTVYLLGGGPASPPSILALPLPVAAGTAAGGGGAAGSGAQTLYPPPQPSSAVPPSRFFSMPVPIEFPTTAPPPADNGDGDGDGSNGSGEAVGTATTAHALWYPPTNPRYNLPSSGSGGVGGELPPVLVKVHGGPTSRCRSTFRLDIQYWTSRGFGVLDVDYGGSTGYGRKYRRRLRGQWGIVDVTDSCAAAAYAVARKWADPRRLCIDGGSAGGLTALAAVTFRDVFSAACSRYGVADMAALAAETHKFESRYADGLVGEFPAEEARYRARSPIHHLDGLSCPVLLLHGTEDKMVPPNQAERMYEALKAKGIPTCLLLFQGEQHGFRRAANIRRSLESELLFYSQIYGFPLSQPIPPLDIVNLH